MKTQLLLEEILKKLSKEYEETNDKNVFLKIEQVLEDHLKKNINDSENWIRLAIFLSKPLFGYADKAIIYLKELLIREPNNARALLVLAEISFTSGITDEDTINQLSSIKVQDNALMSMLEYMKTYQYDLDFQKKEEYLTNSVRLYSGLVKNNQELGEIYLSQGKTKEGCSLIRQAIKNVTCIFPFKNPYIGRGFYITSVDQYLSEFITGTSMSDSNFKELGELYLKYCPKDKAE